MVHCPQIHFFIPFPKASPVSKSCPEKAVLVFNFFQNKIYENQVEMADFLRMPVEVRKKCKISLVLSGVIPNKMLMRFLLKTRTKSSFQIRELILTKLPNQDLLQCRQVSRDLHDLASYVLNRRHSQIWSWNPHFINSDEDEDEWVHHKMVTGVISGGLPACCRRHSFEKVQFGRLMTTSMVIWIGGKDTSSKLSRVVRPLFLNHGASLTSLTLTLDEYVSKSVQMSDISLLLTHLPNLQNFGFKVCNCLIRPGGGYYRTRLSKFPPLPRLEVLDFEFNKSVIFTDAMFEAYGNQIKQLIIPSKILEKCSYLCDVAGTQEGQNQWQSASRKIIFNQLRDLKITSISGVYGPRVTVGSFRRKYAGRKLFQLLASVPSWNLERLSLNIDDWASLDRLDRWSVAIPELILMISNFSQSLNQLYVNFEYVGKSMELRDWMSSSGILFDGSEPSSGLLHGPPVCPNLKKVTLDSVLMETPLLAHILKGFGNVEQLEFLMWGRNESRWSARYALANIQGTVRPTAGDLPKMVSKLLGEVPSLRKISIYATNEWPPFYNYEKGRVSH